MYCIYRAGLLTYPAPYTFRMIWMLCRINLHFTYSGTDTAACTGFFFYPIPEYGYGIKYRIYRSQGTYVFTERPVNHHRQYNRHKEQNIFPCIQPSKGASHGLIQQNQWQPALQSACRAD